MRAYHLENLSHDAVHGYIPFCAAAELSQGETSEREISDQELVESKLRGALPAELRELPLRVDIARHIHRPHTKGPAGGQNFLFDSASDTVRPLTANELFRHTPMSHRICRVYAESLEYRQALAAALDSLLGGGAQDDLTNM